MFNEGSMERNGNLLSISALRLTRVFKVDVKTVHKCTVNYKSLNLTHRGTIGQLLKLRFCLVSFGH